MKVGSPKVLFDLMHTPKKLAFVVELAIFQLYRGLIYTLPDVAFVLYELT